MNPPPAARSPRLCRRRLRTPQPVMPVLVALTHAALKVPLGSRTLKLGFKGEDVRAWQNILRLDGFTAIVADGAYGDKTKAATKVWQAARGLSADGDVGPLTRGQIGRPPRLAEPSAASSSLAASPTVPKTPVPAALTLSRFADPSPSARTLAKGMKGEDVKSWQRIMKALGYDIGKFGPNKDGVDGDFGATLDRVTRQFQSDGIARYRDSSIVADGKVGPVSRRLVLLRTADAKAGVVSGIISGIKRRRAA